MNSVVFQSEFYLEAARGKPAFPWWFVILFKSRKPHQSGSFSHRSWFSE